MGQFSVDRISLTSIRFKRIITAAVIGLAVLTPACADGGIRGLFNRNAAPESDLSDTDIQQYLGQTLRASGVIQEMVGDAAFLLEEKSIFTDKEVLVINAAKTPILLPDEEIITLQVSGQLQNLNVADVEQTYNTALDPRVRRYEGQPVIIAETITVEEPNTL